MDVPLVLQVPGQYATVQAALDALDTTWFRGEGAATIEIANGTYILTAPLSVRHPQGDRIHIAGASPSGVVLTCQGVSCLDLEGHALGSLDGVTLQYEELASGEAVDGVRVSRGGAATLGPNLSIVGFSGDCLHVTEGSTVIAAGVVSLRECGNDGAEASFGSYIDLTDAEALDNGVHGARAAFGSVLRIEGLLVERSGHTGVGVFHGSAADATDGAEASASGVYGFDCGYGSACFLSASTASGSGNDGLHAVLLSSVELQPGYSFGTTSPAVGVSGNENSWISP